MWWKIPWSWGFYRNYSLYTNGVKGSIGTIHYTLMAVTGDQVSGSCLWGNGEEKSFQEHSYRSFTNCFCDRRWMRNTELLSTMAVAGMKRSGTEALSLHKTAVLPVSRAGRRTAAFTILLRRLSLIFTCLPLSRLLWSFLLVRRTEGKEWQIPFTFSHLADAFFQSDVQRREQSSYEQ